MHGVGVESRQQGSVRRAFGVAGQAAHEGLLTLVALGCGTGVVPRLVLEHSAARDRPVALLLRVDMVVCLVGRIGGEG